MYAYPRGAIHKKKENVKKLMGSSGGVNRRRAEGNRLSGDHTAGRAGFFNRSSRGELKGKESLGGYTAQTHRHAWTGRTT